LFRRRETAQACTDLEIEESAKEVVSSGLVESISAASVRRMLQDAVICPWRYRSWLFPRARASTRRIYLVCDNGSSHRGRASIDRTAKRWPNVTLVQLPVHASWLSQIEIVFSILQRKMLSPNDLTDLSQLADRIVGFERHFNARCPAVRLAPHTHRSGCVLEQARRSRGPAKRRRVRFPGVPIPESTKASLASRLEDRRRGRWSLLTTIETSFRGNFAYVKGVDQDGDELA